VQAGAGVALRSMARAPLRCVAVTVACGIPPAWPARISGALRFTSAEGHPRARSRSARFGIYGVRPGVGRGLRGSKAQGPLAAGMRRTRFTAIHTHAAMPTTGPSHGAEPPPHPRSGFLQLLTPGASPDNSEGSVSEPQLVRVVG
jgi:hypothetical protein